MKWLPAGRKFQTKTPQRSEWDRTSLQPPITRSIQRNKNAAKSLLGPVMRRVQDMA
jgi:hypothetical protein